MADVSLCYDCYSLETAAANAHLSCLRKFWLARLVSDDAKLKLLLQAVAVHPSAEWPSTSNGPRRRDCTGYLKLLLQAGSNLEISQALTARTLRDSFSSMVTAGCVPCLQILLSTLLSARKQVSISLWMSTVGQACFKSRLDILRMLLDAAPVECSKKLQHCAWMQLCDQYGWTSDHIVHRTSVKPLLEYLLEIGVDVNHSEADCGYRYEQLRLTALGRMIARGYTDGIRWLVSTAGADVNVVWGSKQWSCLHAVCKKMWHSTDAAMIKTLLDLGADIGLTTSSGDTVLHTAVSEGAVAVLEAVVLYCNSSASASACQSGEPLIAQQEHNRGYTALHAAVVKCRGEAEPIDMLRVLLSSKDSHLAAALVKQDRTGRTVLHLAVKLRLMEELQLLLTACHKAKVLQSVLHMKDNKGQTLVALVRCMRGESLLSALVPYCDEVRNSATMLSCSSTA